MSVDDDEAARRTTKRTVREKRVILAGAIGGAAILFAMGVSGGHLSDRLWGSLFVVGILADVLVLVWFVWRYEKRAKPPYRFSSYAGFWLATMGGVVMVCVGVAIVLLQMITPSDFLSESVKEGIAWTVVGGMLFALLGVVILCLQLIPVAWAELRKPFEP